MKNIACACVDVRHVYCVGIDVYNTYISISIYELYWGRLEMWSHTTTSNRYTLIWFINCSVYILRSATTTIATIIISKTKQTNANQFSFGRVHDPTTPPNYCIHVSIKCRFGQVSAKTQINKEYITKMFIEIDFEKLCWGQPIRHIAGRSNSNCARLLRLSFLFLFCLFDSNATTENENVRMVACYFVVWDCFDCCRHPMPCNWANTF